MAMTVSFHNGRKGASGAYDVKHNDREFESKYAEHISSELSKNNLYWDCYRGLRKHGDRDADNPLDFNLAQIEYTYYYEHYGQHVEHQNERNEKNRHPERNRTILDVLKNEKTCPEETIFQFGNIAGSAGAEVLVQVVQQFLAERDEKYGEHIHGINWCLHVDEATPHIHERHVFDCLDRYGDLYAQQERALEKLGFELPYPDKKPGKFNNRKMVFDTMMRERLKEIASEHGVEIIWENVSGGRDYLEKTEYVVAKLQAEKAELDGDIAERIEKLADADKLLEDVAEAAYDKACEVIVANAPQFFMNAVDDEMDEFKKWLKSKECKLEPASKAFAEKIVNVVRKRLEYAMSKIIGRIFGKLSESKIRKKNKNEVLSQAKESILELLATKKVEVEEQMKDSPNVKSKRKEKAEQR